MRDFLRLLGFTHIWRRQAESLHGFAEAALELDRAKNKFKAINLSESENSRAFSAVDALVQKQRGLTRTAGVEMITDLHTVFGHLDEALASLDIAGKYRYSFESLFGDKFSSQEIEGQIQSGFKALEMLGATRATGQMNAEGKHQFTESDRSRMEAYFNREAQISAMTGGRVTPAEMLQMARTGGTAVQGLSIGGLTNLTSPLTELGGSRTGTALQSLFQNVVAGHIQQSGLSEWQRLGLMDTSKVEFNKSGIVKSMKPGAIPIGSLMQDDPLKFADALSTAMKKHGVDTSNPQKVIEELGALKMPRNPAELVSLLINQRDRVVKEATNVTNAKDIGGLNTQAGDSLTGKIKQYESAMTDFKVNAGVPMIETAAKLAGWLTPIANFFAGHENVSLYAGGLIVAGKAGVGLLETMITLRQAGILSQPISELAKLEQGIVGASTRTSGLASKLGGLGGVVGGLTPLAVGLGLSAALAMVVEMKSEVDEIEAKTAKLKKGADDEHSSDLNNGLYTGSLSADNASGIANRAIINLQNNGQLQQSFDPWSKDNWWTTLVRKSDYSQGTTNVDSLVGKIVGDKRTDRTGYNVQAGANMIDKLARGLGDPKVLTQFLINARQGKLGLGKDDETTFEKSLARSVTTKDIYASASKAATEQLQEFDSRTQDTAKKLADLSESASPLPTKLLNFGSALQAASAQASGFQMPTIPSVFGSNYPTFNPAPPNIRPPFTGIPGQPSAKPPSILNNFFHKTSALDADGTRRPKTDSVAYLQPLREKTPATTLQRSSALDADAVRHPAYSMAAFHPDTGKLSRVQTIAFTRPLDADAVRRPAHMRTAAIDVNSSRPSFAATQARVATRQGKQIGDVHIHIDGNAPAAKDPQLLAASIREELSKLSQQVGGVTKEMRDDRLLERRITFMIQRGRERA